MGQGMPMPMRTAASALTIATVDPTERSIPPVVITKVIATATIRIGADWRSMFNRLPAEKNATLVREKNRTQTRKNAAIDRTCAFCPRKSARLEASGRQV